MPDTKRPYHHGDLRSALLRAGETTLARVGADAFSVRELARELGVSNNAPRRHFASKQALLDALAQHGFEQLGEALQRAIAEIGPDFEKRLLALARAHIQFATGHRALMALMFATKQRPDVAPELLQASYKALSAGPETLALGQSTGAVVAGDPEQLALTVFAVVEGLISLSVDGRFGGVTLDILVEPILARIMTGLRPR